MTWAAGRIFFSSRKVSTPLIPGRHRQSERRSCCYPQICRRRGSEWQTKRNPSPLSDLAVDRDRAAVLVDDLLDGRKSQPGAEAFRAEQRLEDAGQVFWRDP